MLTDEQISFARAYREQGRGYRYIGAKLGVSHTAIYLLSLRGWQNPGRQGGRDADVVAAVEANQGATTEDLADITSIPAPLVRNILRRLRAKGSIVARPKRDIKGSPYGHFTEGANERRGARHSTRPCAAEILALLSDGPASTVSIMGNLALARGPVRGALAVLEELGLVTSSRAHRDIEWEMTRRGASMLNTLTDRRGGK